MSRLSIQLTVQQPDFRRPVTTEIVDTMADKSVLVLYKELVQCERLGEITVIDAEANRLATLTHAPGKQQPLDKLLRELATKRRWLVTQFLADYPELVKRDKKVLRDLYDPNDYPRKEAIEKQFAFKWSFINA